MRKVTKCYTSRLVLASCFLLLGNVVLGAIVAGGRCLKMMPKDEVARWNSQPGGLGWI